MKDNSNLNIEEKEREKNTVNRQPNRLDRIEHDQTSHSQKFYCAIICFYCCCNDGITLYLLHVKFHSLNEMTFNLIYCVMALDLSGERTEWPHDQPFSVCFLSLGKLFVFHFSCLKAIFPSKQLMLLVTCINPTTQIMRVVHEKFISFQLRLKVSSFGNEFSSA